MSKLEPTRNTINVLAQKYVQQSRGQVSFEAAKKRVIKAIIKGK
jgi:hypothetical protein